MSASPAVILNNIPNHLKKNGQNMSIAVLGSKTGKEVGAAFWKVHPSLPKFMIIFKHKADRDKWHKTSPLLKEMMEKHAIRATLVWYSRDRELVIAEDEMVKDRKKQPVFSKPSQNLSTSLNSNDFMASLEDMDKLGDSILNLLKIDSKPREAQNDNKSVSKPETNIVPPSSSDPAIVALKSTSTKGDSNQASSTKTSFLNPIPSNIIPGFPFFDLHPMSELSHDSTVENSVDFPPLASSTPVPVFDVKEAIINAKIQTLSMNIPEVAHQHEYSLRSSISACSASASIKSAVASKGELVSSASVEVSSPSAIQMQQPPVNFLSTPPPPLRLPLAAQTVFEKMNNTNSNILEKMAISVEKSLDGNSESKSSIVKLLIDNWKPQLSKLENLYEKVLSEPNLETDVLTQDLSNILNWEGSKDLSRSQAIKMTQDFLTQSGRMVGADFTDEFSSFLQNSSAYKVSQDELSFILNRNQLDLYSLFKLFSKNRSVQNLKTLIMEKVKLSGQLFFDFTQLVTDFFNLKLSQGVTYKKQSSPQTSPPRAMTPKANGNNLILASLNKLQDCMDKREYKKSPLLLKELCNNVNNLVKQMEVIQNDSANMKEEVASIAEELAKAKEEARERMKIAQQENKVLRSRNSGLNEETVDLKMKYEMSQNKLNYVTKALDCLLVGEDVNVYLNDQNNNNDVDDDLVKMVQALSLLRSNFKSSKRKTQGQNRINLVTAMGKKYYVHSNKNNNIFVPELEKIIGKKVVSLKISHVVGSGCKEYFPVKNYIDCPDLGWPEVEFQVVTKEHEYHLGQGCANTNGSGQRRLGDGGPMFPPHVVGPRICTA